MVRFGSNEDRLAAVRRRDAAADGAFVFSVSTTGVFCLPSCAARPALTRNIAFHDTPAAALRAGFRPCRRCRPDGPPRADREAALVRAACRTMDDAESPPSLAALAAAAGCSPFHFHRMFRRVVGVTPRAYAAERRAARVRTGLLAGKAVTAALFEAGFNAASRFYAGSDAALGMAPRRYGKGGEGERIGFAFGTASLGRVLVAETAKGVCALLLGDDDAALLAELRGRFPRAELVAAASDRVAAALALVDAPGKASEQGNALPLDIRGTAFQHQVWAALRRIPPGTTLSYTELAAAAGRPGAVRAVASACAANPVAVVVPCHRVVRGTGALAGYRWGLARKAALLAREAGSPLLERMDQGTADGVGSP